MKCMKCGSHNLETEGTGKDKVWTCKDCGNEQRIERGKVVEA